MTGPAADDQFVAPPRRPTTVQLDLFAPADGISGNRLADACTVLAEQMAATMRLLFLPRDFDGMSRTAGSAGGCWGYQVDRAGIHFEHESTWGGWASKPANLITWPEVDDIAADPRLAPVRSWIDGGGETTRPYELWPGPGGWHPDYIASDHAAHDWPQRLAVWQLLIAVITDRGQLARGLA